MSSNDLQIILAWTEDSIEFVRERRTDLGERPETRPCKVAHAAAWLYHGTEEDVAAALKYAATEGHTVYVYPQSIEDPRGQARADVLAGRAGQ